MEIRASNIQEFNQMDKFFSQSLEKVYNDIHTNISNGLECKDFGSFQVSFDGIFVKISEEEDMEIEIGQIQYVRKPLSSIIEELRNELSQIEHSIEIIKLQFKELIEMAGDISQFELEKCSSQADYMCLSPNKDINKNLEIINSPEPNGLKNVEKISQSAFKNTLVSNFNNILKQNFCKVKIESNKNEIIESNQKQTLKFGGLSIAINQNNKILDQLKRNIVYKDLILKLYSSFCIEKLLPNNVKLLLYKKKHIKGTAIKIISQSYICRGFAKDVCIDDCYYEDVKGSKMHGKMVKGLMFGKGSYRLDSGNLFKGEILNSLTACGEMLYGNTKTVGTWKITRGKTGTTFVISGHFKRYIDGKLDCEGVDDGKRFTGSIYKPEGVVITGIWIRDEFQNVKIYKCNKVTELKRHSESSYNEITYEDSLIVSKFTVVNGKREGKGFFKFSDAEENVKFENNLVVWGKINQKSRKYEGSIQDNMYQGKGKLETDTFVYSGEFLQGEFHGQGSLDKKTENCSLSGTFRNGVMVKGVVKKGLVIYNGELNASEEAEGHGTLTSPSIKYEGKWRNNVFHGNGTLRI